jgi:flagellar P-ring protein precursor FlgI
MSASPSIAQITENGARIKDLARFAGIQSNALIGYGLVIGLPGTGDSAASISTNKSAALMLSRLGATASPNEVSTKNIAAVLVTAELRPFARIGDRIQVRVSSVGDSKSLQGGTLILTPLKAANGQVFATAQGHLSTGTSQAGASGGKSTSESSIRTVALTDGGTVERVFETSVLQQGELQLSLIEPDFTTASRIAQAINSYYSSFIASAANSAQVAVAIPEGIFGNPSFQLVDFVATLEQIRVAPDSRARIVIAERTGTIILGSEVRIAPVAISHGFLEVKVENKISRVGELTSTATIGELVSSLNALGAGPKDLVSIIQALSKSGAIQADLIYM